MCVIISNDKGKMPEREILRRAFVTNDDGWGLMWHKKDRIYVRKGFTWKALKKAIRNVEDRPYVLHFRWATHGRIDRDNTHPFKVTEYLWMAHNGIIHKFDAESVKTKMSDSWHFTKLLAEKIEKSKLTYDSPSFIVDVANLAGAGNKLAFLDVDGTISLVNSSGGIWKDDIWYSNTGPLYETVYTSNENTTYACTNREWYKKQSYYSSPYGSWLDELNDRGGLSDKVVSVNHTDDDDDDESERLDKYLKARNTRSIGYDLTCEICGEFDTSLVSLDGLMVCRTCHEWDVYINGKEYIT